MNIKTKLIISAALVALLSAPASARIIDDGGASAYPRFKNERTQMTGSGFVSPSNHLVNRPFHQR
jgi:hypothetical protein